MKKWLDADSKIRKKIFSATSLLLVSALLLGTASYAWLSLAIRPEVASVATNIASNGTLEIALGKNIEESAVGDSFDVSDVTAANRTWGNLIDLSDPGYGLQKITLRPAMLNSAGGAVNTLHPFAHPVYGNDGRVESIYANDIFAAPYNGRNFVTTVNEYGVRGIGAADYTTPGNNGTFGPPTQRQEIFSYAYSRLYQQAYSTYMDLCNMSFGALKAYEDGTVLSAYSLDLNSFSDYLDNVITVSNEELKMNFTLLAAAEATPAENYHKAINLLETEYPNYEDILPLVEASIRHLAAEEPGGAIAELRGFQNMSAQLKAVMESGTIDSSDGYSKEEIGQTVGLVFDLEKSYTYVENYSRRYRLYGKADAELECYSNYNDYYKLAGFSIDNLTRSLSYGYYGLDEGDREYVANEMYSRFEPISNSLRLSDLDQAIASLYASHWDYWDFEEYTERNALGAQIRQADRDLSSLRSELSTVNNRIYYLNSYINDPDTLPERIPVYQQDLEIARAQKTSIQNQINDKTAERQALVAAFEAEELRLQPFTASKVPLEYYDMDDSRLEVIRSVMEDTIATLQRFTFWAVAYYSCDGTVPDNAYHRFQEMLRSSEDPYMHPRDALQILLEYGVTLSDSSSLMQMLTTCERLEQELLFLPNPGAGDKVSWTALYRELQRLFGTIQHSLYFYNLETPETTIGVLARIREEVARQENGGSARIYSHHLEYTGEQPWEQALGLLNSFWTTEFQNNTNPVHTMEDRQFSISHYMEYTGSFGFGIQLSVGSEENFNGSGLTVRQTRFRTAQENISYQQNLLVTAAVNAEGNLVSLLTELIAGRDSVSLTTIADYLTSLQQQWRYADEMLYQGTLAMAASDYADDYTYSYAYADYSPKDAIGLIDELQWWGGFDQNVLTALNQRMELLRSQEYLLDQALSRLSNYRDSKTGELKASQVSAEEAVSLLEPVLDTSAMFLYGYVKDPQSQKDSPRYLHTVLYEGYGSPSVQITGKKAAISGSETVTLFGDAYLALGRSLSGALLALAKSQVETYAPPSGGVSASDITALETGMNRQAYAMGTGESMYTLNLYTVDTLYALSSNLWTYTGNTAFISAGNSLMDLYGYCVDLSLRTNAAAADLLLQTEAINRIYNDGDAKTDTAMGAGSFMEFTITHPSYSLDMAREYMSCIRVAFTDTNTGYIYGYAALDMNAVEDLGITLKAPLRLYSYDGKLMEGTQYLCHMDQNLEKNLTVYVYLDGSKTSQAFVSAYDKQSLTGILNLQFSSSADLHPAAMDKLR